MIENAKKITLIFIDYAVNFSFAKQTTINSENIDKFNLKLIRASTYFSQFNIDVRYKADKMNVVSNALSRLLSINIFKNDVDMNTLKINNYNYIIQDISVTTHVFQESLVLIIANFRTKFLDDFFKNKI